MVHIFIGQGRLLSFAVEAELGLFRLFEEAQFLHGICEQSVDVRQVLGAAEDVLVKLNPVVGMHLPHPLDVVVFPQIFIQRLVFDAECHALSAKYVIKCVLELHHLGNEGQVESFLGCKYFILEFSQASTSQLLCLRCFLFSLIHLADESSSEVV